MQYRSYFCGFSLLFLATVPLASSALSTTFEVLVLLALLVVLGETGWRLACRLLPSAPRVTRLSAAGLGATALATVPATVLGHFGWLWPEPFFLTVAALAGLVWFGLPRAATVADDQPSVALPTAGWPRALAAAAVFALLASAAASIHFERYAPPGFHGFDDNSYHLATVATWLERGDLAGVKFAHGDRSTPYYPIVGELVSWVLLAPFEDNDSFARWSQLPFFLLTLVAIAALGRRLGLPATMTLLAVVLYAGLKRAFPILALGAGNDHAATFFTLAGVEAVLLLAATPSLGAGVYLGLAVGLLLGTKFLGLLFLPLLAVVFVVAWLLRGPGAWRAAAGRLAGALVLAAAVAAVAGGYTYARNAVTAGNPLYPVPIRIGALELPGTSGVTLDERRHLPPFAIDLPEYLFRSDLFGRLGRFLWAPAAILAPLLALGLAWRRAGERRRWLLEAAVWALPAAFFLIFLFQIHDHRDSRYLFPALGLAALGGARLIGLAGDRGRLGTALAGLCWLVTVGLAIDRHRAEPIAMLAIFAFTLVGAAWALRRPIPSFLRQSAFVGLVVVLFLPGLVHAVSHYPERKLRHLPAARALEEQVGTAGAGVAYVGYNYPYPFWGSRLQNRVAIVPRNFWRASRLYYWQGTAVDFSSRRGRYEAWQRNLRALGIDYVVVIRAGEEDPERAWMAARPGRYERFYDDGWVELWRIRWGRAQSPNR
jgi:hypothetical protein